MEDENAYLSYQNLDLLTVETGANDDIVRIVPPALVGTSWCDSWINMAAV